MPLKSAFSRKTQKKKKKNAVICPYSYGRSIVPINNCQVERYVHYTGIIGIGRPGMIRRYWEIKNLTIVQPRKSGLIS